MAVWLEWLAVVRLWGRLVVWLLEGGWWLEGGGFDLPPLAAPMGGSLKPGVAVGEATVRVVLPLEW